MDWKLRGSLHSYCHCSLIKSPDLDEGGAGNQQDRAASLHHFISQSPWQGEDLEKRRLKIILAILEEREIVVMIDETGDKKKGKKTDYVKRQYIGNLGKIEI